MRRNQHSDRIEQQRPWVEAPGAYLQLKIQLLGVTPAVWRRIVVRKDIDLRTLDAVIQAVMGWKGRRWIDFMINDRFVGTEELQAAQFPIRLENCIGSRVSFRYCYDMMMNWAHRIKVEMSLDGAEYEGAVAAYIKGKNAAPDEMVFHGPDHYDDVLYCLQGDDAERAEAVQLVGPNFDPSYIDQKAVQERMREALSKLEH